MNLPFKAVIYDAGHTLLQGRPTIDELCDIAFDEFEVYIEPEQLRAAMPDVGAFYQLRREEDGLGVYDSNERARSFWRGYYLEAFRRAGIEHDADVLSDLALRLNDWYGQPEQWTVFDDAWIALEEGRRRGLIQGVVSDWGTDLLGTLATLGLTQYFKFVVVSAIVGRAKPAPEIFNYALERAGVQANEAVYVGDSYIADVLGARGAGLTPVLVERHSHNHKFDCLTIPSLDHLFAVLDPVDPEFPLPLPRGGGQGERSR
ncbi:MAG: HAD-IA family hydrolase [Dehalococcoidia bacterium]